MTPELYDLVLNSVLSPAGYGIVYGSALGIVIYILLQD